MDLDYEFSLDLKFELIRKTLIHRVMIRILTFQSQYESQFICATSYYKYHTIYSSIFAISFYLKW